MLDFKKYWNNYDRPLHAHKEWDWAVKYAKEIIYYLNDQYETGVYAGCGNGDVLRLIHDRFSFVYALDFSEKMIEKVNELDRNDQLGPVSIHCASILDINRIVKKEVDVIFNNHVIQYLSPEELNDFISKCNSLLKCGGRVILLNVPNRSLRLFYLLNFFREEEYLSPLALLKRYAIHNYQKIKFFLKGKKFEYDGIGYWYSIAEFKRLGVKHNLNCEIDNSLLRPYGYRMNVVFTKKTKNEG